MDGFVIAIPKKNTAQYKKMAREGLATWKKFGALDYKECVIDDAGLQTGDPRSSSFAAMVKLKKGETIWFSFITYKSRRHRDQVNKKVMAYFAKKYGDTEMKMPFEMTRFAMAGFRVEVGM